MVVSVFQKAVILKSIQLSCIINIMFIKNMM